MKKMKRKEYERQMRILHGEMVAMQEWVKESGAKICIVFEGRDTAGKGGTIKRITERVSPRVFRVVALPAPTEREKSQMYIQRYVPHFPAAGEVVIFDRSWYNRAGVERVMGFCTPEETDRFLSLVPGVEKAMTDDGILLLKYWLEVSPDEQTRRLESRRVCSSALTSSQYFSSRIPESAMAFSTPGTSPRNRSVSSGLQKPMTRSTPARLYQLRSKITTSPAAGKCAT